MLCGQHSLYTLQLHCLCHSQSVYFLATAFALVHAVVSMEGAGPLTRCITLSISQKPIPYDGQSSPSNLNRICNVGTLLATRLGVMLPHG